MLMKIYAMKFQLLKLEVSKSNSGIQS